MRLRGKSAVTTSVSLHTGYPGSYGDNEATGKKYERQTAEWVQVPNGDWYGSDVEFDVDPGRYVTAALWRDGKIIEIVGLSPWTCTGGVIKIVSLKLDGGSHALD